MINHWAHQSLRHCDTWWENETEWHRDWKSKFNQEWQEVVHHDSLTNEKHVADIKTSAGLVVELQNSTISLDEVESRERFYGKMIWIVNAEKFANNFHFKSMLPDPNASFLQDIQFLIGRKNTLLGFWRPSENLNGASMVLSHPVHEISELIRVNFVGHYLFQWVRPRHVWYRSNRRVFFDFGHNSIFEFMRFPNQKTLCVRAVDKTELVNCIVNDLFSQELVNNSKGF